MLEKESEIVKIMWPEKGTNVGSHKVMWHVE